MWSRENWDSWLRKRLDERKEVFSCDPDELVSSYNRERSHASSYEGRELLELIQNADDSGAGYSKPNRSENPRRARGIMHENEKPWHLCSFIPELRFRDRQISIRAWQNCKASPRVVILNYYDLKSVGLLKRPEKVKSSLGENDIIILSCVGKDNDLDELSVESYFETAQKLGVKAIITPDDYIYKIDSRYVAYQAHHFRRAIERSETLIKLAGDQFNIIGLIVGANEYQISLFVNRLKERGVTDFACACGDIIKRSRIKESLADIRASIKHCKKDWKLLLGIDSRKILLKLNPDAFSSGEWSFYACHNKIYRNGRKMKITRNDPKGWKLALHNLNKNYSLRW
jgi:hypothetical protein